MINYLTNNCCQYKTQTIKRILLTRSLYISNSQLPHQINVHPFVKNTSLVQNHRRGRTIDSCLLCSRPCSRSGPHIFGAVTLSSIKMCFGVSQPAWYQCNDAPHILGCNAGYVRFDVLFLICFGLQLAAIHVEPHIVSLYIYGCRVYVGDRIADDDVITSWVCVAWNAPLVQATYIIAVCRVGWTFNVQRD